MSPEALSSSVGAGEEHDKLMSSFASRRTSLLLPFWTVDPNWYAKPIKAHSSLEGGEGITEDDALLLLLLFELLVLEPTEVDRDQPVGFVELTTTFLFIV